MKIKIAVLVLILILAALACNLPAEKPDASTPQAPRISQTSPPPQPSAETTLMLSETDACKLFDEVKASQVMGESVPAMPANTPGYSACTFFTNTGKGIYITITMGDQAKKNFLNEISQYQKGCSVSYSGGTSTATPFPPEIEALMSKSVLELFQMDIQMQVNCGGKVEPLPEFGPNAYAYLTPVAFQIGRLAIVSGDNVYSFAYADPGLDIPQMVEKAKEIARVATSSTPVVGPTPIGSPTLVEGSGFGNGCPTPIGGGPTPVSCSASAQSNGCPTPIGGGPTPVSCSASTQSNGCPTPIGGGPTPVSCSEPSSAKGPTPIGDGPTPVERPTQIGGGPTRVRGPTPIGGGPTRVQGPTPIGGGPTPIP